MTKETYGYLMADLGQQGSTIGRQKARIGVVFSESDRNGGERLSIKIDTLPVPGAGWTGWCNIWKKGGAEGDQRPEPAGLSD